MPNASDGCPSRQEWMAFGAGLVDDDQASRLGGHLDECETCREVMETVHSLDPLEAALRRHPSEIGCTLPDNAGSFLSVTDTSPGSESTDAPLEQFTRLLIESGLFEADELQALRNRRNSLDQSGSVQTLVDWLIGQERLTAIRRRPFWRGRERRWLSAATRCWKSWGRGAWVSCTRRCIGG